MKLQYTARIEEGRLIIQNRKQFDQDLLHFEGKAITIQIEKKRSKRSNPQNRYLHGVVLEIVRQGMLDAGFEEARSKEWVKDFLKFRFLKSESVSETTGEIIQTVRGTSELTKSEFMDLIADIQRWSMEFLNTYIPDPNEVIEIEFN